jgi:cytochrome o ubiquinol oxidase subunit IV
MSEASPKHKNSDHGSVKSYVIGFVLSLIFTFIPYHLVVQKVMTGNVLLTTILGIAILQMFIQIFFFLHLGRGPKPLYNISFFFGTAGTILVVVMGSIFIINNLHYQMTSEEVTKRVAQREGIDQIEGEETGACQQIGTRHRVTIDKGSVSPVFIEAKLCDSLTFINQDGEVREIAFGQHPNHDTYAGEEILVHKSRPKTIALNEVGTFMFHDHLDPSVAGLFKVSQ